MTHILQRFEPRHVPMVRRWLERRSEADPSMSPMPGFEELVPPVGFVVDGIVAGHLRLTDTPWAYLDHYVSNPTSPKEARRAAVEVLTQALTSEASRRGVKVLCGFAHQASLVDMVQRQGFVVQPGAYTYFVGRP